QNYRPISNLPFISKIIEKADNCPPFWYIFNGRCYKYVATLMTWADAEQHCVNQGANLVLNEHNFVNLLIKNFDPTRSPTWIGLTDMHKEGGWIWSDGCKYRFSRWDSGQPDNYHGNEHCGLTNYRSNFYWNDGVCSSKLAFVCATRNDALAGKKTT
uniref:C-type lectin domain-containing protein n=1 Tax=Poecilia reticulata TaxID=8081 RepID=A0A3P9N6F3_POERE